MKQIAPYDNLGIEFQACVTNRNMYDNYIVSIGGQGLKRNNSTKAQLDKVSYFVGKKLSIFQKCISFQRLFKPSDYGYILSCKFKEDYNKVEDLLPHIELLPLATSSRHSSSTLSVESMKDMAHQFTRRDYIKLLSDVVIRDYCSMILEIITRNETSGFMCEEPENLMQELVQHIQDEIYSLKKKATFIIIPHYIFNIIKPFIIESKHNDGLPLIFKGWFDGVEVFTFNLHCFVPNQHMDNIIVGYKGNNPFDVGGILGLYDPITYSFFVNATTFQPMVKILYRTAKYIRPVDVDNPHLFYSVTNVQHLSNIKQ